MPEHTIQLNLRKNMFAPKFYPLLFDYSHRWEIYMGSAGSAKSYFITQKLIVRAVNEKIKIIVCRRTATTIRNTCFSLFKEIIDKWQLKTYVKIRESDFNISFPNGSEIIFIGLDEETKLLSLNNISCIFVEEAFEVPQNIVEQLNLRMRGSAANQQIIMAFNPISIHSWLHEFCENTPPEDFLYTHSTYKDNPFLNDAYIKSLEELYTRNPQKARIYCDGEWGIDPEGLVFQNWKVEAFDVAALSSTLEHRVGSDFGYIDPSTIVDSLYDAKNRKIYVYQEFYKRGCQLDEVLAAIHNMNLSKSKIYMDSAEPRSIQFFKNNGINAVPCIKGADSVKARIAFLQNNQIIISPSCKNVIMEFENFSYEKNRTTGEYKESYTHEYSHAIDGLGYAYSDIYTNTKLQTMNKALFGL